MLPLNDDQQRALREFHLKYRPFWSAASPGYTFEGQSYSDELKRDVVTLQNIVPEFADETSSAGEEQWKERKFDAHVGDEDAHEAGMTLLVNDEIVELITKYESELSKESTAEPTSTLPSLSMK